MRPVHAVLRCDLELTYIVISEALPVTPNIRSEGAVLGANLTSVTDGSASEGLSVTWDFPSEALSVAVRCAQ